MISRSISSARRRSGFTLVEMLVALGIFVILATITLGAFRGVSKDDQISAASQTVKGWFERARSLAIHDRQPRGVRLLLDPSDNPTNPSASRLCVSASYVGSSADLVSDLGQTDPAERSYLWVTSSPVSTYAAGTVLSPGGVNVGTPGRNPGNNGYAGYAAIQSAMESGGLDDVTVRQHGLRIEVPINSGQWYPIRFVGEDRNANGTLDSGEDLNSNGAIDPLIFLATPLANYASLGGQLLEFRLEVGPTVISDQTATALPRGLVIDLDGSTLPASWHLGSAPNSNYSSRMDFMIGPNGAFVGNVAASTGVAYLCISTLDDALAARLLGGHPSATSTGTFMPFLLADPKTAQKLVVLQLATGRIATANVDTSPGDSDNRLQSERATTSPLRYAVRGRESK